MLIHEAIEFAAVKHRNQVRKGTNTPYIVHPMEVMYILAENGCDETVIAAGLLHDTVEDAGATLKEIEEKFGKEVADIVAAESEDKSKSWQERKQTTIDRLPNESFEAQLVCCADKLANVRSMFYDYLKIGEKLWERFNKDKFSLLWYYSQIRDAAKRFSAISIWQEYSACVEEMRRIIEGY